MSPLPHPRDLIPHQGTMCLNERILAWDDQHVRLATRTHAAPGSATGPPRRANPAKVDGRIPVAIPFPGTRGPAARRSPR